MSADREAVVAAMRRWLLQNDAGPALDRHANSLADAVLPLLDAARAEGAAEVVAQRSRVEELIEASSLGTPKAKAARDSVPREVGSAIALAARYLGERNEPLAALRRVEAVADWCAAKEADMRASRDQYAEGARDAYDVTEQRIRTALAGPEGAQDAQNGPLERSGGLTGTPGHPEGAGRAVAGGNGGGR